MLTIIYNIPGAIVTVISFAVWALIYHFTPHISDGAIWLGFFAPLAVSGYVAEVIGACPRLYHMPVYLIGAVVTVIALCVYYSWLGAGMIALALVPAFMFAGKCNEQRAWSFAQASLASYQSLRPGQSQVREQYLLAALFQNKWTRRTREQLAHNRQIIESLLNDREIHPTFQEIEVLKQTLQWIDRADPLGAGLRVEYAGILLFKLQQFGKEGTGRLAPWNA